MMPRMARMLPIRPVDVRSAAEERLFQRLATALPDPFVVMHSVKWLEKTLRGGRFGTAGSAQFQDAAAVLSRPMAPRVRPRG